MINTVIVGFVIGVIYFNIMEKDIPHYTNCSYVANIWTDILAFIVGGVVIYYGYYYKNHVLVAIGTAIITEHIMQFFGHKYEPFSNGCREKPKVIETLVRQSSRYALAAEQDMSPLVAVLHANYAAAYLWALKDVASDAEISNVIGKDKLKELESYVKTVQDTATKRATRDCPSFIGASANLKIASLAGDY
jgi:hypothetical protein